MIKEIVLINGHHIYYERYGLSNSSIIILLHHGLGSTYSWKDQTPALVNAGYQVLIYDRWGYGESDARSSLSVPKFETDCSDLLELMNVVDIKKAALLGHSDGGTISLYFAIDHPERLTCILVVAAHIYAEPRMEKGIMQIKREFQNNSRIRRGLEKLHGANTNAVFDNWFNAWVSPNILNWTMQPLLSKISCNTLVVQGDKDEHATPKHAEDIAKGIPNSELWLVHGQRHMLPQENPEVFNQGMLEFLFKYHHDIAMSEKNKNN